MNAKDTAIEMVDKFFNTEVDRAGDLESITYCFAKKCADICIDYLIKENPDNYYFYNEVKRKIKQLEYGLHISR